MVFVVGILFLLLQDCRKTGTLLLSRVIHLYQILKIIKNKYTLIKNQNPQFIEYTQIRLIIIDAFFCINKNILQFIMRQQQVKQSLRQSLISNSSGRQSQLRKQTVNQNKKAKYHSIQDKYFSSERYIGANFLSNIFFTWVSPLLTFGDRFYIQENVVPILQQDMRPSKDYQKFYTNFKNTQRSRTQGITLGKAACKTFKAELIKLLLLAFASVVLSMCSPILTNQIMTYVQGTTNKQIAIGIGLFMAAFFISFFQQIGQTQLYYHFTVLGYTVSNTLSLLILSKALKYPALCQKKFTVAEIINYSQTDAQRLTYLGFYMSSLLFTPIKLVIGIWLMYSFIGISFVSGFVIIILVMICTFTVSRIASKGNDLLLKKKDERLKVTEEIFNIIRFIKINAMEKFFFRKLNQKRNQQLKIIKKVNLLWVITIFLYWLSVPLILSATFATYIWLGYQLTPTQAFTTIILFRILQFPLRVFPSSIAQVIQIWSSAKRIQKFLLAEQISTEFVKTILNNQQDKYRRQYAIEIKNGSFKWGLQKKDIQQQSKDNQNEKTQKINLENNTSFIQKLNDSLLQVEQNSQHLVKSMISQDQSQQSSQENGNKEVSKPKFITALKQINLKFRKGKFTMIVGDIGSGKSSLLYAILNQMKAQEGSKIQVNGSIAFVAQKPWIMSSTVKQNITMTNQFQKQRFDCAVKYAALDKDIQIMIDGVDTQIGQKGVNLSGGQKARISLARAIYCDRDIYLLDDIISAVDVHVGRFLMKETVIKCLQGKTILMATHAISFAEYAEEIIFLKQGRVVCQGTYHQISRTKQFLELVQIQQKRNQKQQQNKQQQQKGIKQIETLIIKPKQRALELMPDLRDSQVQSTNQDISKTEKLITQLMLPEDHRKGKVTWKVYRSFININGGAFFVIAILSCVGGWLVFSTVSNIQMQKWCDNPQQYFFYFYLYVGFSIGSSVFMLFRAYFLVVSGIKQGAFVHKKMIKALLYTSIPDFYNRVPIGRIINRLTKDLRTLDQSIGYSIGNFLVDLFSLIGNLVICVYASSFWIVIPMAIIAFLCLRIKEYYIKTQREVVRLQSITSSPIVSGFISVMNGLATIRAYNLQKGFLERQFEKIDTNKRMRLTCQGLQSWFSLRLTFLCFFINMTAIGYSIFTETSTSSIVGLLLTYALTLSQDVTGVMLSLASLQTKMVSVERVMQFMQIQPQPGYAQYCKKWRTKEQGFNKKAVTAGHIQFDNFSVRYRQGLPLVLSDINIKIKAGQKVGIVGRTGAGKSTITSCLLRILDPCQGRILIDGINIADIPLKDLRSCLTMIEQQPTLMNGSIRQNLDPDSQYTNQQLQIIADQCNLKSMIESRGGMQEKIANDTLSVGQKQLLCICRAFLKQSKIVLIDQATANIDIKNDELIQQIITKKFTNNTVLTIAHRLSTLKNSDKILVLGEGKVIQFGTPCELMKKQNGFFREMTQKHLQDYLK